jgi:glycosyltransferase involved in cell wall biosynthesis
MASEQAEQLTSGHLRSGQLTAAICIGTYNQAQYLRGSIESALSQVYPIEEIWIADDYSTDDTQAIVQEYCERYPNVHYHRHESNVGPARNLSWALARPSTDLVVRLDSDDRLEPEYVSVLAGLMQRYPQAGYAHCDVWEMDGDGKRTRLRQLTRTAEYEDGEQALKSNGRTLRVAANCILFRSVAIRQANYYLEHPTWTACEDWDLALRMILNGWGNVYAAKTLTNYRQWDDPKGVRAYRKIQEVTTNTHIFTQVLIPEYTKRGWDAAPLRQYMREKAVGFADSLDSPRFSEQDRKDYRTYLKELGDSPSLSLALFLAEMGLNPALRKWKRLKRRLKDYAKRVLRSVRPARPVTAL